MLDPNAPKEGIGKDKYYLNRFGPQSIQMESRMTQVLLSSLMSLALNRVSLGQHLMM